MDIIKIIAIGIIAVIISLIIKQYKPEFAIYISIIAGILILGLAFDKLADLIKLLNTFANKSSVNGKFIMLLIKITGIAILTEFAVSLCKDSGESAIANKIDISGKIMIVAVSIPIFSSLLEIVLRSFTIKV